MNLSLCLRYLDARPAFAATLLAILASSPGILHADTDNRPIVVLREDDCSRSWTTPFAGLGGVSGLAYGKAKRIPITWAVITNSATAGTSLTWAELKDYVDSAGGEIASHSCSHSALPTEAEYIKEITDSKAAIESHLPGYTCTTFLQPGPWSGDAYLDRAWELDNPIGRALRANYSQSMAYLGGGWHVGSPAYRYGTSNDGSIDYGTGRTITGILKTLDMVAGTPGIIFVFSCHAVQEFGDTQSYCVQADLLKAFMDKLAELRDAGTIRLMGLHVAYHATASTTLNRVPDPGFELCNPGPNNPYGPVSCATGCTFPASGGRSDSRYVLVPASNWLNSGFRIDPGRYRFSWWQQPAGPSGGSMLARFTLADLGATVYCNALSYSSFDNYAPGQWEQKSVLVLVPQRFAAAYLQFRPAGTTSFGLDDLSVVPEPVDPAVSPSNTLVTPDPLGCTISWNTPADPDVAAIAVRYGSKTHPMTPSEGIGLPTVTAVHGTTQQAAAGFNWNEQSYLYFSVFAVKANGEYSPPDLGLVMVDTSAPTIPLVDWVSRTACDYDVSWTSQDPESGIYGYYYAVGTGPARSNVVPWTATADSSVRLSGLPDQSTLYVSVKAENPFGQQSVTATEAIRSTGSISDALRSPDGFSLNVTGIISAVFDGYYYIETPGRAAGIRVLGCTTSCEGDKVAVWGQVTSVDGERAIDTAP